MAEDAKSNWTKAWEVLQTLGLGAGILSVKGGIENAVANAGKKAAEKIGEKVEKGLGLSSEAADKTFDDEALFEKALVKGTLSPDNKKKVRVIIVQLRKNKPELAKELVRWIYNTMIKFESKKKETTGPKDAKEERTYTDYSEGIEIIEELFNELIATQNDQEIEDILLQRNILVKEKKKTPLDSAEEAAKNSFKKATGAEKGNRQDLEQTSSNFRAWAKNLRDSRK